MGDLSKLFEQLKTEFEGQLGHKVYSRLLKSGRAWGLYADEDCKRNFAWIGKRIKTDCLRIGLEKKWADHADVPRCFETSNSQFGREGAHWVLPEDNSEKLKEIAKYLAKVYRLKYEEE